MPEPFTDRSRHLLMKAQDEAWRAGSKVIDPDHLLLALLEAPDSDPVVIAITAQGVSVAAVRQVVRQAVDRHASSADHRVARALPFGEPLSAALEQAFLQAVGTGYDAVRPEHLFLGLLADDSGIAARSLVTAGSDVSQLRRRVVDDLAASVAGASAHRAAKESGGSGTALEQGAGGETAEEDRSGQADSLPQLARRVTGWGGSERSLSTQSMRAALLRYRIMAYVVGTLLSILCFVGLPLQFAAHYDLVVDVVGTIHGYCYLVYLAIAYDMARRVRWRIGRLVPVVLSGLVPGLAFFMERRITPQVEADIDLAEAQGIGLVDAP